MFLAFVLCASMLEVFSLLPGDIHYSDMGLLENFDINKANLVSLQNANNDINHISSNQKENINYVYRVLLTFKACTNSDSVIQIYLYCSNASVLHKTGDITMI